MFVVCVGVVGIVFVDVVVGVDGGSRLVMLIFDNGFLFG